MDGEVLRIGSTPLEVELLPELGGRLHRLRAFGHDLLRTPRDRDAYAREPFFWGSFPMAPWCNRIEARPTPVGGRTLDLPPNFADGTAIHGQVQALPWSVAADGALRVAAGGDEWPWAYEVEQRLAVEAATLSLTLALTNHAADEMPAGIGMHPWFRRPLEVRIAADEVFTSNHDSTARPAAVRGPYDLRTAQDVPPDLDATWVAPGPEPVLLRWPDLGLRAELRIGATGGYVCAASPTGLQAVAVEPQTHAPDGLRRLVRRESGGLAWLPPGSTLQLEVELRVTADG